MTFESQPSDGHSDVNMDSEPTATNSSLTPGSESESEEQTAPTAVCPQTRRWNPRSCYECNSRKIRCDKREPCASCARAGRPCAYPPLGPRKRRAKKTMMADMASRISTLEKSAARVREEETSAPTDPIPEINNVTSSAQPVTALRSDHLSERCREDVLVQKGSSSQYFNEIILSRVIGKERNIESVLTPPTGSPHLPISSPFNALGILSSPSLSVAPASFHPPQPLAVRLWNIYVDYVDGCTFLKVLHLPTDEVKAYSTIADPMGASPENLALSFAIYFAATVSLDDPEVQATFGREKHMLLLQFKVGIEQAFAHGDFLDRPTITGLHALTVYLSALRVHNHGKGIWVLNGLAIRIAQSLGLHRDGERLGLQPFQSEIRRRLWWHLLSRDGRAGEDYGLENISSLLLVSDVALPGNFDDIDLSPEMRRLPAAKEGWTAMTLSLINIDLAKSMQKLAAAASSSRSSPPSKDVRAQIVKETELRIEKLVAHCNPVIPRHRLTLLCSRFLLRKLDFVTKLQWILLQRAGAHTDFVTEENLVEALEILKPRLHPEDGLLDQFAWARKAYPQYHVTMYVLWHLCVKPDGPNIDRAWEVVENLFTHDLWDSSTMGFGSKRAVLAALKAKAVSVREKSQSRNPGGSTGTGDLNPSLACRAGSCEGEGFSASLFGYNIDALGLDRGRDEWPNWATFVQGFQFDIPDVLWQ